MQSARWLCGAVLALGLVAGSSMAHALSVSPTVVDIDGRQVTRAKVRITAPGNASLVLDLSILERHADGTLAAPTAPSLVLHPPQLFVPAGGSADVSLQWVGEAPADGTRSFYLLAEQLPVAMEDADAQTHIHMLARVHLPVHVGGVGTADLRITHEDPARVVLSNRGRRHARLAMLELHVVRPGGDIRRIPGIALARVIESDALLPGARVVVDAAAIGIVPGERALALEARP